MKVVISQPMYFPWVGMLEQIALADVYIHYSDVQFSKGSFTNRVQIKTDRGIKWLTVPLDRMKLGQKINEVLINNSVNWQADHIRQLTAAYHACPFFEEVVKTVNHVFEKDFFTIDKVSEKSVEAVSAYFGLTDGCRFVHSTDLGVSGSGSRRVLDLVHAVGGTEYITGHGARNYLDHHQFDLEGVTVSYMDYRKEPYNQLHGPFTPFVSALDLIANKGKDGRAFICSGSRYWKDFLSHE